MPKEIKDINFNAGFNSCEARMQILKNEVVERDLSSFEEIEKSDIGTNSYIYVDQNGEPSKIKLAEVSDPNQGVQSDWAVDSEGSLAFIRNKPDMILDEDIISSYDVGSIRAGDVIHAGQTAIEILKQIFGKGSTITIKFGILNSINNVNPSQIADIEDQNISDLLINGLTFKNVELNNQYYCLLLPRTSDIRVNKIFQGGYRLNFKVKEVTQPDIHGMYWDMYYQTTPVTGIYTFTYNFIDKSVVDSEGN